MKLWIGPILRISLNGSDIGRRGVGGVFGSDIPTSKTAALVGDTIDCLCGAAEFTVLL